LLWQKSARLFDLFADLAELLCPTMELLTPRAAGARGSHIAFRHEAAETVMRELIAGGVIGDFRPPDVLRFGLTPLYTRFEDVWRAVKAMSEIVGRMRSEVELPAVTKKTPRSRRD
jgi:kynureninase